MAIIVLNAMNNAYKENGEEVNKVTFGKVILWVVISIITVFLTFGRLIGAWGSDTNAFTH